MQVAHTSHETARAIAKLCLGGDRACTHGDLAALREIAQRLAVYMPEPLHCDLIELADCCMGEPTCASARWPRLKDQLFRASE